GISALVDAQTTETFHHLRSIILGPAAGPATGQLFLAGTHGEAGVRIHADVVFAWHRLCSDCLDNFVLLHPPFDCARKRRGGHGFRIKKGEKRMTLIFAVIDPWILTFSAVTVFVT